MERRTHAITLETLTIVTQSVKIDIIKPFLPYIINIIIDTQNLFLEYPDR